MQNVLKLSIMPMVTAPAAGTPTRSKKRISSATLAAELGTASAMNWIPYWSMRIGQKRILLRVAPRVEAAWGICTRGHRMIAAISQPFEAPLELLEEGVRTRDRRRPRTGRTRPRRSPGASGSNPT